MEILLPSISLETLHYGSKFNSSRRHARYSFFENRNKEYGAYELRKTYNKRIKYSVAVICMLCLLLLFVNIFAGSKKSTTNAKLFVKDFELTKIPDEKHEEIKPPEPKPKLQNVSMKKVTSITIVPDKDIKPEERPPANAELDNVKIGLGNKDGINDDVVAPPVEQSTGTGEGLKVQKENYDSIFATVEVEAQFPGGLATWTKYLETNLRTEVPLDNGAPAGRYTVVVSFLVDKDGNVSDIKAVTDPGYGTAQEAVRAIKKSKQWIPAMQNGQHVNYRQQQSITFVVEPQ